MAASATPLQDRLDAITARTRSLVQADRLAISEGAVAELFTSGIEDRVLTAGSAAPAFTLEDSQTGRNVSSADLLALGPLVLKFFRGRWDPYCVTELEAWRDLLPALKDHGALLVAVSPQSRQHNDFTAQQHHLPFPILTDAGSQVAGMFGLTHTIAVPLRDYFRSIMINIPNANSGRSYDNAPESAWRLPLPGLFLIRPDGNTGTIAFASAFADNRVRPEPADLLALL